jgi:hypothetical protein
MRLHFVFLPLAVTAAVGSFAYAQSNRNMEYSCVGDMVAGVGYSTASKKWSAKIFPVVEQFELKLKFVSATAKKDFFGKDDVETKYEVDIITPGSSNASACMELGTALPFQREVTVTERTSLRCYWGGLSHSRQLTLNLKNQRFLEVYLHGYLDGKEPMSDDDDDQPLLVGGTCKQSG